MADFTPGHDPLDDRLRKTFAAEHADIERRRLARTTVPAKKRSATTWMPLGIAAALLAIAGFAFFGNRGGDTAIDLGVAEQPDQPGVGINLEGDDDGGSIAATTGDGEAQTPDAVASPSPTPTPTPAPGEVEYPTPTPVPAAGTDTRTCPGVDMSRDPAFVWGIGLDDPDGGLVAHTDAAIDAPITRVLPLDYAGVRVTGSCKLAANGSPWFEIFGPSGPDWVSSNYLRTATPACLTGEQFGAIVEDGEADEQIFGPVDGWAIEGSDKVAFAVGFDAPQIFRWYPKDAVSLSVPCYLPGPLGEDRCLSGQVAIFDLFSAEVLLNTIDALDARTTGRLYAPLADRGLREEFIEVFVEESPIGTVTGFIDPALTTVTNGTCPTAAGGSDALADVPCTAANSEVVVGTTGRGTAESTADHVQNIRVEERAGCTRIVIDFGTAAGGNSLADRLPFIGIQKEVDSTTITMPTSMRGTAEIQRVDFGSGVTLYSLTQLDDPQVVTRHSATNVNVWFPEYPARVVIDLQGNSSTLNIATGPIVGDVAVLESHIQTDLFGPGITENASRQINGYARPFESQGDWYVFAVDEAGMLAENPTPVASGVYRTTTWVDGWGEFQVTMPGLPAGHYVALFGSHPPGDDLYFAGSGQYFRVGLPANGSYVEAREIDYLALTEPFGPDS